MKDKKKIGVLISILLISLLAVGAVNAADDTIITDGDDLAAVDELQAVDNTQTTDEIYDESSYVVTDTDDCDDSDLISDYTGLQDVSDNGDEAVVGDNVNPKNELKAETTTDETVLAEGAGTFTDLNNLISRAPRESTIILDRDYVYNPSTDSNYANGITIQKDITIDGAGHTIDGNNAARMFILKGETSLGDVNFGYTYTFTNINFINGYSSQNQPTVIKNPEYPNKITINNCNFTNNHGPKGTIEYTDNIKMVPNGILNVTGCIFANNTATSAAAISAVLIGWDAHIYINHNVFVNNTATSGPHVIYFTNLDRINIEENWWGQNTFNEDFVRHFKNAYRPETIYQVSINQTDIDTVTLQFQLNNSQAPSGNLPLRDATFSISSGTINPETGSLTYGIPLDATFNITEPVTITATVDNQSLPINIDRVPITVTSENVTLDYPRTGSVNITASVAGTYNVKVGDRNYTVTITENGGTGSIPIDLMDVGEYGISVTADFGGFYIPVDTGVINYYNVTTGTLAIVGFGTNITYPEKESIIIIAYAPGVYTLKIGDKTYEATLIGGINEFIVPDVFNVGTYEVSVSASFPNYYPITDQYLTNFTVKKGTITVNSTDVNVDYPTHKSIEITASVAGDYKVEVGGDIYNVHILSDGGTSSITVPLLDAGVYPVTVSANLANYEPIVDKVISTYTVNNGTILVSATNKTTGYPKGGEFTVTASVGGHYIIKCGNYSGEIIIDLGGGSYQVRVPKMNAGVYDIIINGTIPNYNPVEANIGTYTVYKGFLREFELEANATTVQYGNTISLTSNVEVYEDAIASGTVRYYIDGFETGSTVSADKLTVGTHTVVAKYTDDPNIEDQETEPITITVLPVDSSVRVDPISFTYGTFGSADVTLFGATGFTAAIEGYPNAVIVDGNIIIVSGLPAGSYTMVVTTIPDANHNEVSINVDVTVDKADSIVDLDPISFEDGGSGSATVTLAGATGFTAAIDNYPNAVSVNGDVITVSGLPAGSYTMVVTTIPDANHKEVRFEVPIGVGKENATLTLNANKQEITFGESVTLTAALSPNDATGDITYWVDGILADSNVLSDLSIGTHTVVAKYSGDDTYNAVNSNRITITVNKVTPVISLSADKNEITFGESVTLTAAVSPDDATGDITYWVDGILADSNVLSELTIGKHTIVAKVAESDYYNAAESSPLTITVNKPTPVVTLSVDKDEISYGESVTLTGSVDPVDAGTVTYYVNGVLADSNVLSNLAAGNYIIIAKIAESDNYNAAESSPVIITVNKVTPIVSIAASKDTFAFGEDVVLDVTVMDDETGVTGIAVVNIGDVKYAVDVTDGTGQLTVKGLSNGIYEVTTKFIANDNYNEAYAEGKTLEVTKLLKVDIKVTTEGNNVVIKLTDEEGKPVDGKVNATIDGITREVNVNGGQGTLPISGYNAGNYVVIVNYAGDENHASSLNTGKFNVAKTKTQIIYKDMTTKTVDRSIDGRIGEYFNVTLKDAKGNPLANKKIQIGFNGNIYNRTTNATGGASLQINLKKVDVYTFAIAFLGDENYEGSFAVAKITTKAQTPQLVVPNKSYKATAKTKSLTATFKTAKGTLLANKKISFTVNGKTYSATTNAKGVATVNVSLNKKGTYSFTAKFAGDTTYAAITKTATLKIT